ncbi:MAG: 6-bladed beta-propeller [Gemmatimonadota bacterium]
MIAVERWDTVFALGSVDPTDTTLVSPSEIEVWNDQIAVLEGLARRIQSFDARTGRRRWSYGREGRGPGELAQPFNMWIDESDNLRVWDDRNRKQLVLDQRGEFFEEIYYRELWGLSTSPTGFGQRMVWTQLQPGRPAMITDIESHELVDSVTVEWPVPPSVDFKPELLTKTAASPSAWAAGLYSGPFFAVGTPVGVKVHPLIEPIPYTRAPGAWFATDPRADSSYYGARDIAIADSRVFILSGGRPKRAAHASQPTTMIDVYSLDGEYLHSYRLPFDGAALATRDGRTFYVATLVQGSYPHIFGLRPAD